MTLEALTETAPIIERLNKLEQYLPNQKPILYKFAKGFAYQLGEGNKMLTLSAFVMNAMRTLENARSGDVFEDILTAGYVMDKLPTIAKTICSDEFAQGVVEFLEE
ncbi:MAG: hypothetical protein Q8R00_01810 [Candidatus Nanoarchaeia archaeon]|nr:hypothetical protein [Candidatus Nanoarchaeia archaeon]